MSEKKKPVKLAAEVKPEIKKGIRKEDIVPLPRPKAFDWGDTRSHHKKPVLPEPEEYSPPSETKAEPVEVPEPVEIMDTKVLR